MLVRMSGDIFVADAKFSERDPLKEAGFEWRPDHKCWATRNPLIASRLRPYADSEAKTKIDRSLITVKPWTGRLPHPHHLTPRPFQLKAAEFALSRNYSYIAADPGLGKTIIEAIIINALMHQKGWSPVVIVNQPGLCLNTEAELDKWCFAAATIKVFNPIKPMVFSDILTPVLIVPDTRLEDKTLQSYIEQLTALGSATLFVDEAQRFNNEESKRSQALFRLAQNFDKIIFMSGTPIRNDRPIELWPILSRFAGESIRFRTKGQYGTRYCNLRFDQWGHADYSGCDNFEELVDSIKKKFMLRLKKADVLPELPPKTEEIVFLSDGETPIEITEYEKKHLKALSPTDCMRPKITTSPHISTYRRLLGRAKVPAALKYIREVLKEGDEALLIFTEHKETAQALLEALYEDYNPFLVTGDTPAKLKQHSVEMFQRHAELRVFIGNTQACGLGFTLTKATRVIHVEPSWVPADSDQASDRAHRIGQTEPVFVQYLVFRNSLDRAVIETAIRKREEINKL